MSAAPTLTWEQYQQLPPDKRSRPLTPAEYAALTKTQLQQAGLADVDDGAPVNFNGPVFPNPDHLQPQLDTDPTVPVTRLPNGVSLDHSLYRGDARMDVSNPAQAEALPEAGRVIGADFSPQSNKSVSTVPIFAPDGSLGDVPFEQLQAAIHAGAKPGVSIKAPDGSIGVVPADRYQDAAKAGGTVVPYKDQDTQHPGFWAHAADLMGGLLHPSGFSPYPGMDMEAKSAAATDAAQQDQARKKAGYSLPYRALAPVAQSAGVNVPAMEQSAAQGDVAGVAAGAAVPLATLAAGEAIAHGAPAVADAAKSAAESRAGRAVGKTALEAATDFPVIRKLAKLKENYEATAPNAQPELDATGDNKPFAGGADEPPPQKVLDATGENKPFAGGMDEATAPKKPIQSAKTATATAPKRTVVLDPKTGQPEFSDVVTQKQQAAQTTPQPKPVAQAEAAPAAAATDDPILQRLRDIAAKNETGPRVPEPDEDLTGLLQQSLDQIKAKPGGVMTTADPAALSKRWGVDTESLNSGREQTRGMSPEQTEDYVNKLADSYKKGRPVEPVMETRDEDNNVIDADGRARVLAAQRAGIERVPIMIRRVPRSVPTS